MFQNDNSIIIKRLTKLSLKSDKKRNFFIVAAITLTTFMIASVLSIGISLYETINMQEKRMLGSVSNMAFAPPTKKQLEDVYNLDYIKNVGIGAFVARAVNISELNEINMAYIDKTQWLEMFCPTFTNITGHYPKKEKEIMLSRYILGALGIENPSIGMEIPLSYKIDDEDDIKTDTFILSCIYTEYSHISIGGFVGIYVSEDFAKKYDKLTPDNITINIIFKDEKNVGTNIERLKQDLNFTQDQEYVQSPEFSDNYGNSAANIALALMVLFLMFTGYLLIYNVMFISVSKDVRFYGMLKMLGTTPKQLRRIVNGQMLRLCIAGLPIGCVFAAAVSFIIVPAVITNSNIDTGAVVSFSPLIYIGAVFFSVLTSFTGSAAAAKKAASISPVEAMKFTEGHVGKLGVYSSAKGKPYKMALRNIFRDRKRAAVVITSLFLGITVFITLMTVINSIDVDKAVNESYDYDYMFYANDGDSFFLSEEFVDKAKELTGVKESGIITLERVEVIYSEMLDRYVDWSCKKLGWVKNEVIKDNSFAWGHGIKGIDRIALDEINKTQQEPVDVEAFERGEIALIQIIGDNGEGALCFADVSEIEIKCAADKVSTKIPVRGVVSSSVGGISYSDVEIIVSNNFINEHFPERHILSFYMNVESSYDAQIYNAVSELTYPAKITNISRYKARTDIHEAKIIMYVLGGGISGVLGLIGIFNFINVISVGVMVRKRELSALECVGMSKKQMRSMLRSEGVGYAVITLFCAMSFGNLIAYGFFLLFKNVADYAQFTYPFVPVFSVCVVILLISFITPEVVYVGISGKPLVERLRETELA